MANNLNTGDYSGVGGYFSLWGPRAVFGMGGQENRRQVFLFLGVLMGAACKVIYDWLTGSGSISWTSFAIALIASVVVFPQLYYSGGLQRRKLSFAHWTLAFQNGFFWSVALDTVFKKFHV